MLDFQPVAGSAPVDIASMVDLPARLRPTAGLGVLDITEFFGETTGGVRTYLLEKARYVQRRPALRQTHRRPRRARRDPRGEWRPLLSPPRSLHPDPEALPLHARHPVHQPDRRARAAGPDRGRQHLVRAVAGAPGDPAGGRAGGLVLSQQLSRASSRPGPQTAGRARRTAAEFAWGYVRRLGRLVRATLAPSGAVARELERAGVERVVRVRLGVDLDRFNPARRARARPRPGGASRTARGTARHLRRPARRGEGGRPAPSAWPEVSRRTGAALALVGEGPARRRLQRRAGQRPRALGSRSSSDRDQLADLYAAADLLVRSCSTETFGLVGARGARERHPGARRRSGRRRPRRSRAPGRAPLFAAGDAGDSGRAGRSRSCGGDLPALGAAGRRYAEADHGWDTVLDRLFDVYRRVLARVSLLVSIHDVTPALADGVLRLWALCAARGRSPRAAGRARLARRVAAGASSRRSSHGSARAPPRARRSCCTASGTTRWSCRAVWPIRCARSAALHGKASS